MQSFARILGVLLVSIGVLLFVVGAGWTILLVIGYLDAKGAGGQVHQDPLADGIANMVFLMFTAPGLATGVSGMMLSALGSLTYLVADIANSVEATRRAAYNKSLR